MQTMLQDVRFGLRMLAKNRGFTAVAVLTLALGIGGTTAIFSVINAILLRPLPYQHPSDLARVWATDVQSGASEDVASYPDFADWQEQSRSFERMAAYAFRSFNLSGGDQPETIRGLRASAGLLPLLGVRPAVGRVFLPEQQQPGKNHVVLLTDYLWRLRFGRDPGVLGKTVKLNEESYVVIGILPPHFAFPPDGPPGLLVPLEPDLKRGHGFLNVIARLKPGITLGGAQSEMDAMARRLEQQYQADKGRGVRLMPLQESYVSQFRLGLQIFLGAVGFVLLIACANVANLFLGRAATREKEIAVRSTLGASRLRVVRQLLTESMLSGLLGGTLGLVLASWGVAGLVALASRNFPDFHMENVTVDGRVLCFTLVVALITGLLSGLAPAVGASNPNLNESLKESGRGVAGNRRHNRVRSAFVISEVGLSMVLLSGAGLMIKSFWLLARVNPGLHPENVLTVDFSLHGSKYAQTAPRAAFFQQVLERVQKLPGVQSAAVAADIPLGGGVDTLRFGIEGLADPAPGQPRQANFNVVGPGYFRTLGIRLLEGRDFSQRDAAGAPGIVLINQAMARHFWPHGNPLGQRISTDGKTWFSIAGVVADVRQTALQRPPEPEVYLSYLQDPVLWPYLSLLVRTTSDPLKLVGAVQGAVWSIDKEQPMSNFRTMEQIISTSMAPSRVTTLLLGTFATLALVLSAVGIYGVMAYSVTQRTHEMGIRTALGAHRADILRLVVGQGFVLALMGTGVGLMGAFALTRSMGRLLYGVQPTDPTTFAAVATLLTAVGGIASYIPARRATKVDPMVALRYE